MILLSKVNDFTFTACLYGGCGAVPLPDVTVLTRTWERQESRAFPDRQRFVMWHFLFRQQD